MRKYAYKSMKKYMAFVLAVIMLLQIPLTHVPLDVWADGVNTTTVSGTILWEGDSEDARPEIMTVNLLQNGSVYQTTKTDASKNWEYSFTAIPKENEADGTKYVYTVESESLENYISNADGESNGLSVAFSDESYSVSEDYGALSIYYELDGELYLLDTWSAKEVAGTVVDIPSKVFYLYWDGDQNLLDRYGFSIDYIISKEVAISDGNKAENLPDTDIINVSGIDYPETMHPYTSYESKLWKYEGFGGTGYNIVEIYNSQDISGTIDWIGDSQEVRPDEVTVELKQDGADYTAVKTNSANNWKYSFENVPKYNEEMEKYNYSPSIASMDDYAYSCESGSIVCTYRKADIELDIHWDSSLSDDYKKEDFTFNMVQRIYECDENGSYTGEYTDTVVSSVTTNASKDWVATFENVTRCDGNGEDYTYLIMLENNEKYDISGQNVNFSEEGNELIMPVTIIPAGKTITGLKSWKGDKEADRPAEIELILYQNGAEYARTTTSAEKNWEYSFGVVPEIDEHGNKQEYYIKEVPVYGYTALYYADGDSVELTFSDEMASMQHTSFSVYYKSGEEYICVASFKTLSEAAGVTVTVPSTEFYISAEKFIEIPFSYKLVDSAGDNNIGTVDLGISTTIEGAEIKKLNGADGTYYPLNAVAEEENNIHGYSVTTSSNDPESGLLQLVNSTNFIDIPVTIMWDGVSESERPESVTVQLTDEYGNDYGQVVLSQDNGWASAFESVTDRGDVYTLKAIAIEGFDAELSGNIYDGYVYKVKKSSTSESGTDNWELDVVFYDSTVNNGKTPLTAINWDASDGGYRSGEPRVITVQINYKNTNAITTYEVGDVRIKIDGILKNAPDNGKVGSDGALYDFRISWNVGANDSTHTGYDWDYTAKYVTPLYASSPINISELTFTNANIIEEKSNFEGSIQIQYTITPRGEEYAYKSVGSDKGEGNIEVGEDECTNSFSNTLKATINTSDTLTSNEIVFNYTRTQVHPWKNLEYTVEKSADKITSYDLFPDNADEYIWVIYNFLDDNTKGMTTEMSRSYSYPYICAENRVMKDILPEECIVYDINFNKLEPDENNVYTFTYNYANSDYFKRRFGVYVGYPKSVYNEKNNNLNITNTVELWGTYYGETESEKLAEDSVSINLADFMFEYTGELYGIAKDSAWDLRYQDIMKGGSYNTAKWVLSPKARYMGTPMTVKIGDDLLYITDKNNEYVRLAEDEYCFKSIKFNPTYLQNGNGVMITAEKYNCELWVKYKGSEDYVLYEEFLNPKTTKQWDFKDSNMVSSFYFMIYDLKESLKCGYSYDSQYKRYGLVEGTTPIFKKDINESGKVYNFGYFQVYFKDDEGNLVLQNEPTIDSYANTITQSELATYDQETYGTYMQRSFDYASWSYYQVTQPLTALKAYKKAGNITQDVQKEAFYGTFKIGAEMPIYYTHSDRNYQNTFLTYIEDVDPNYAIDGFYLYDLLPEGMELISSEEDIIKTLAFSTKQYVSYVIDLNGNKLNFSELMTQTNTDVEITENWKGTNRTRLAIAIKFDTPFYLTKSYSNDDSLITTYEYAYSVSYDSFLEWGSVWENTCYVDGERKINSVEDTMDIDEDGHVDDFLSKASATATIVSVVSTHQDVQTQVQTDSSNYSTGTVKATPETEYSYKLRVRSGLNQVSNLVIMNNLEENYGSNKHWKGEFLGIDTSFVENKVYNVYDPDNANADSSGHVNERISVKVYYSENTKESELYVTEKVIVTDDNGDVVYNSDGSVLEMPVRKKDSEGNFVKNANWLEYNNSVDKSKVKSLAFEFLNAETGEQAIIPANSLLYVELLMKAPEELAGLNGTEVLYAYNNCFTQWNALDEFGGTVDFVDGIHSNTVKVSLVDKVQIIVDKIWDDNNDVLGLRPDSIDIILKKDNEEIERKTLLKDEISVAFDNIPIEDLDLYTVDESLDSSIYTKSNAVYNEVTGHWEITNTLVDDALISISGTKTWMDDAEEDRPESITVNLLQDGIKIASTTTDKSKNWEYSFTDVPILKNDGTSYDYSVTEDVVEGYVANYNKVAVNPKWYQYKSEMNPHGVTVTIPSKEFYILSVSQSDEMPSFDYILKNTDDADFSTLKETDIESLLEKARITESMDELKTEMSLSASPSEYTNASSIPYEKTLKVMGEPYYYGLYHFVVDADESDYNGVELIFAEKTTRAAYTASFEILIPDSDEYSYNIVNTKKTTLPLEFTKVDFLTGDAMGGVSLDLYKLICTSTNASHDHGKAGNTSCWESVSTGLSDAEGKVSLEGLEKGNIYGLVETVPSGYALPGSLYWKLGVADDGSIVWATSCDETEFEAFTGRYGWLGYDPDVTVKADGSFEISNIRTMRSVTAVKRIKASDINFANGNPAFLFKLTGTDVTGEARTYYRSVEFTESYVESNKDPSGYVTLSAVFDDVVAGSYVLSEEDVSRYEFAGVSNIVNGTANGESVSFDLVTNANGSATYTNKVYESQWFSHNDIVTNHF